MSMGERLRARRKTLGWSGGEAATRLGISTAHVSDLENGKRNPSLELLGRLAQHYAVTTDYLLGLEDSAQETMHYVANPPPAPLTVALAEIADSLGPAEQAAWVEMGRALQRMVAARQEELVRRTFLRLMGDFEAAFGEDAAEALYSAVRTAAHGEMTALRAWVDHYVPTADEHVPKGRE
jgi:transcriptional regulator with XRE-family HTH domain